MKTEMLQQANTIESTGKNERHAAGESRMPALDGLRGWAVLAVMLYHFALPFADYAGDRASWAALRLFLTGSYGVDMFFVLSGFLITGILLDTKNGPGYFKMFYMRRVLRIFPLYYGVLAVCFGLLFWMPIMKQFVPNQHWLWLYIANFSDLAGVSFEPMFSHFWSLAIEEQFYMVWPLVVLMLSRRSLMVLAMVLAIGSPLLRCTLIATGWVNAELAANLTPCRLDGLAIGALLAGVSRGSLGLASFRHLAIALVAVGGLASLISKGLYGSVNGSIWGLSGIGHFTVCGAVAGMLVLAVSANGFWAWLLSNSILRFFGKYSYGLYVFHYLLQPWMNDRFWYFDSIPALSLIGHMVGALAVSTLVAVASWHLYENQFLKLKRLFEYKDRKHTVIAIPLTNSEPVAGERRTPVTESIA